MEIFVFFNFLNDNYFPVSWGYHHFFGILTEKSYRATEEIDQNAIYHQADCAYNIKRNLALHTEV